MVFLFQRSSAQLVVSGTRGAQRPRRRMGTEYQSFADRLSVGRNIRYPRIAAHPRARNADGLKARSSGKKAWTGPGRCPFLQRLAHLVTIWPPNARARNSALSASSKWDRTLATNCTVNYVQGE